MFGAFCNTDSYAYSLRLEAQLHQKRVAHREIDYATGPSHSVVTAARGMPQRMSSTALAICIVLAMAASCASASRVLSAGDHGQSGHLGHAELDLRGHRQHHSMRRRLMRGMLHVPHLELSNSTERPTAGNAPVRPFVLTNSTPAVLPGCSWSPIFQRCQPTHNTLLAGGINMTNATFAGW